MNKKTTFLASFLFLALTLTFTQSQASSYQLGSNEFDLAKEFLIDNIEEIFDRTDHKKLNDEQKDKIRKRLHKMKYVNSDSSRQCKKTGTVHTQTGKKSTSFHGPKYIGSEPRFSLGYDNKIRICYQNLRQLYYSNGFCALAALMIHQVSHGSYSKFSIKHWTANEHLEVDALQGSMVNVCREKGYNRILSE